MRRAAGFSVLAFLAITGLVSCGYSSSSTQTTGTGLTFRAFVSNPLTTVGGTTLPALQIIDASKDVLATNAVNVASVISDPGMMAVSPNKKFTLVFSAANQSLALIDNVSEAPAQNGTGNSVSAIALPDFTESMFISADNSTGYAAVRNAPVTGKSPGVLEVVSLNTLSITNSLPIPNVHYVAQSHNGNRILAFGDNQNTVTIVVPAYIGTNQNATITVCQDGTSQTDPSLCDPNAPKIFDHPVWGVFNSDDTKAYILSCGPECGGSAANVAVLDLTTNTAVAGVAVAASTIGTLDGSTLYVAGTPPNTACGSGTAATTCGTVQSVNVNSMTASTPLLVTDGYHYRMEMGSNGQVFLGAKACTDIDISGGEVRGCLSVFNSKTNGVVIPPETGDVAGVTGIQPITDRNVVYVVEGGELWIYDTTTDKLQPTQIDLVGQAVDVKLVDF